MLWDALAVRLLQRMHDAPFDVEPKDLDAEVVFALDGLLARIELFALVDVLAAGVASPARHEYRRHGVKNALTWKRAP